MPAAAWAVKKRSPRAGKASPPLGRGAGSQLTRQPRATPDRAAAASTPGSRVRVGQDFGASRFLSPQCAVCQGLPGQLDALKGFRFISRPEQGLGKWILPPLASRLNAPDPTTCFRALKQLALFPRALEKGGDPGIHSRVRARGTHQTRAAHFAPLTKFPRRARAGLQPGRGLLP